MTSEYTSPVESLFSEIDFTCPITGDWLTDNYKKHPIYMAIDGHYYSGAIKGWFKTQRNAYPGSQTVRSPKTGLQMGWELFENPQPLTRLYIQYINDKHIEVEPISDHLWNQWTNGVANRAPARVVLNERVRELMNDLNAVANDMADRNAIFQLENEEMRRHHELQNEQLRIHQAQRQAEHEEIIRLYEQNLRADEVQALELQQNYAQRIQDINNRHYRTNRLIELPPIPDVPVDTPENKRPSLKFDVNRNAFLQFVSYKKPSADILHCQFIENGIIRETFRTSWYRYTVCISKIDYVMRSFDIPVTIAELFIKRRFWTMVYVYLDDVKALLAENPGIFGKITTITNQNKIKVIERLNALANLEPTELKTPLTVVV